MDSTADEKKVLISVEDLSFSYGPRVVLSHVTFNIFRGDFLAIIGPNGSGKTTLIKIILGLLKPDQGIVRIMSSSVEDYNDWGKIGYVPQKATSFDPLFPVSVKEVITMGMISSAEIKKLSKQEQEKIINRALKQVDLEDLSDWRIGKLSAGQQQRVFIARAIVNQPHILFLDEPTTGVDAETQENFYRLLGTLNKDKGITIVLITHEIGIIDKHVNQVACLNRSLDYHGSHSEFCQSDVFKKMLLSGHHVISHRH
jgi:zinc transport system ATP-binding protein